MKNNVNEIITFNLLDINFAIIILSYNIYTMTQSITIVGAGWLAQHFLKSHHSLFDSIITTSQSSSPLPKSTQHIYLDIYKPAVINLPKTETILITIPFSRQLSDPMSYYNQIKKLIKSLPEYKKIIFTSSTSIYPETHTTVTETSPLASTSRAQALNKTEQFLLKMAPTVYILRLSGICGFNRTSEKKILNGQINNANQPVNLIHAVDICNVFKTLIKRDVIETDIINVTCSKHPTKIDYYSYLCKKFNYPLPIFEETNKPNKKVSNKKLLSKYDVKLNYPSPLLFEFNHD
mgnify:CR=1 FL=1|tara:strand:+ start:153 stop:1028 length:876 start_codon:yes stop_codon:yes gene_type:complete